FSQDGTVTAANASTINDGAAALVVASEKYIKAHGLTPIAEIIGYADAAHEPGWFTTAPVKATSELMTRTGFTSADIDLYEVNEAFAVVPLVFAQSLKIDLDKMNILGGAVSLGHPLGASGARSIATLVNGLTVQDQTSSCASICNGGRGASAMIIRRVLSLSYLLNQKS